MNPHTQLFQDGSSPQQLSIDFIPDEEFVTVLNLSNDERGLFVSLRLLALTHGGLPENLDQLWSQAKNCFGISRYKFFKLAPRVLELKFENFSGRFYFVRDNERIEASRDKIRKSRSFGKLGADSRWKTRLAPVVEEPLDSIAPPSDPAMRTHAGGSSSSSLSLSTSEKQKTATTTASSSPPPPSSPPLSDAEYQQFREHCRDVTGGDGRGVPIPDRALCEKIRAKFPDLVISEVLERLPRFPGQKSAALWLSTSAEVLTAEGERQRREKAEPYRKPVAMTRADETMQKVLKRYQGESHG